MNLKRASRFTGTPLNFGKKGDEVLEAALLEQEIPERDTGADHSPHDQTVGNLSESRDFAVLSQ
jgi:hypothetical protein